MCSSTVCDHPSDIESVTDFNSQPHSAGLFVSQSCAVLQGIITASVQNLSLTIRVGLYNEFNFQQTFHFFKHFFVLEWWDTLFYFPK